MFSLQHILWLLISAVAVAVILIVYEKKKPPLKKVLNTVLIVSLISEFLKVFGFFALVPSSGSGTLTPYLPLNQLPLHLCSLQFFFILYARFTRREDRREYVLAFMYPTTILGAVPAMLLPNFFRTGVTPEQTFTSVIVYQFFVYHIMLVALGAIIARSGQIRWNKKHYGVTLALLFIMGFASFYLNSVFSSPTYVDGTLVSVDFSTNFFYSYQNPLGIPFTAIWQWYLYLIIMAALAALLIFLMYAPFLFRKKTGAEHAGSF